DAFQFRKQVLSLIRFLIENGATILFTSEASTEAPDEDLMFLSDGVINLEVKADARIIEMSKFRGSEFIPGLHSYKIGQGGVKVFPRIIPELYTLDFEYKVVSSGIPEVDELLKGGLEMGTITMISGPTGVGKTTFSMIFLKEAAGRGENSVVYSFEETEEKLIKRCESVNIPVKSMIDSGRLKIRRIEPLTLVPDEFANMVREDVEQFGAKVAMIDSTSGYEMAMGGENPREHLHAVCRYMANMGLLVLLPTEIRDITGTFKVSDQHISYLADNIIFLRYIETKGELRRAIGVLKKRLGDFEKTLREYSITRYGIRVGEPLKNLRNILSGTPESVVE
ncbi:ATPase domain-containing protein, partial [Desulfothermus sp.]